MLNFNVLKEVSADEEVREIYRLRSKTEYDNLSERNIAVQKAKAEGLTEGEKIGAEKEQARAEAEKRKMAKELLKLGLSIEQISKTMNIPPEEIENFR